VDLRLVERLDLPRELEGGPDDQVRDRPDRILRVVDVVLEKGDELMRDREALEVGLGTLPPGGPAGDHGRELDVRVLRQSSDRVALADPTPVGGVVNRRGSEIEDPHPERPAHPGAGGVRPGWTGRSLEAKS